MYINLIFRRYDCTRFKRTTIQFLPIKVSHVPQVGNSFRSRSKSIALHNLKYRSLCLRAQLRALSSIEDGAHLGTDLPCAVVFRLLHVCSPHEVGVVGHV